MLIGATLPVAPAANSQMLPVWFDTQTLPAESTAMPEGSCRSVRGPPIDAIGTLSPVALASYSVAELLFGFETQIRGVGNVAAPAWGVATGMATPARAAN